MMKLILSTLILLIAILCLAFYSSAEIKEKSTDWTCMADCQAQGYLFSYCKKFCSY